MVFLCLIVNIKMTELQFLIDLLLNQKLNTVTKKLIASRISEVEEKLREHKISSASIPSLVNKNLQSASTQAILDREAGIPGTSTVSIPFQTAPVPSIPATAFVTNRIVGGEKSTGNGMRGPRKF